MPQVKRSSRVSLKVVERDELEKPKACVTVDIQSSAANPLPAVSRLAALTVRARKTMVAGGMLVKVTVDVESQVPHKI